MRLYVIGWVRAPGEPDEVSAKLPQWVRIGGPYGDRARAQKVADLVSGPARNSMSLKGYELIDYRIVAERDMGKYGLVVLTLIKRPLPGFDEVGP